MTQEAKTEDTSNDAIFVYRQDTSKVPSGIHRLATDPLVQEFPNQAFRHCHALVEVNLSEGLRQIADFAFVDCQALQKVSIPSTVKRIGNRSFHRCTSLVEVSLKDGSLRFIDSSAFGDCKSLKSMQIPSSVAIIGQLAFGNCTVLKQVEFQEGLQIIGNQSFQSCVALQEVTIPASVVTIENCAFRGCHQLRRLGLLNGLLEQLKADTFGRCYSLSSISVPPSITSIKASFSNCKSLVHVELVPGLVSILDRSFENCKALTVVELPATLQEIGKRAFSGCEGLSQINFPDGLMCIGVTAFFGCSSLSAVAFPISLKVIEKLAFGSCMSLLGIEFPKGCNVELQGAVFHKCGRLVNLSFPSSMQTLTLGDVHFLGCERLKAWNDCQNTALMTMLRERFHGLPVHQACYDSSSTTVDDLGEALSLYDSDNVTKDCFGMTAFHIVATSYQPRSDILGALLDKYGIEAMNHSDAHGATMLDYMLLHNSPRIVPLIQMVLQRTTVASLSCWGLEPWRMTIGGYLEELSEDGTLRAIREQATLYYELEMMSLLELTLWKMKKQEDPTANDEHGRLLCGANIVIPQVVAYLWNFDDSSLELPFSLFPFHLA